MMHQLTCEEPVKFIDDAIIGTNCLDYYCYCLGYYCYLFSINVYIIYNNISYGPIILKII